RGVGARGSAARYSWLGSEPVSRVGLLEAERVSHASRTAGLPESSNPEQPLGRSQEGVVGERPTRRRTAWRRGAHDDGHDVAGFVSIHIQSTWSYRLG